VPSAQVSGRQGLRHRAVAIMGRPSGRPFLLHCNKEIQCSSQQSS
jgi:hypothetical protein